MHSLGRQELQDIIRGRLSRTMIYLQRYSKELPKYLTHIRNKIEHPISELHILIQQITDQPYRRAVPSYSPPEEGIPDDMDYFALALNEIKTALIYFKQRKGTDLFKELSDYYLEQKISSIIHQLETLQKKLP
jgi:hypothetical protein